MDSTATREDDLTTVISKLNATRSNLVAVLASSTEQKESLDGVGCRLSVSSGTVAAASAVVAPLQTESIAVKALQSRINRAVSPALSVLHSFSLVESLQRRLVALSNDDDDDDDTGTTPHLARLLKYVDCVDRLNVAIGAVTTGCEPAVVKLQEAVEFLSRTKATDQLRIHRLRETLGAIKALYEGEVDAMRYEGLLDEALLRLQDDYEGLLQQIRHKGIAGSDHRGEDDHDLEMDGSDRRRELGSELEVQVLGRISEALASNDCLDICIDIYVKARYRRAAKALMRLNPRYLKTFAPEEIDRMEWEALESAIALWIEHFKLAVNDVFVAEKKLCKQVLSGITDGGAIWPECFAKIADKIMAAFFRFGEGLARSSKEPQKLFKLLDMYDAMDQIRPKFTQVFDGESGSDIRARFRELQKLLVHAASQVFWEFGLQIEGLEDGAPPPPDGAVPKVVRYAVNYLKCLAGGGYAGAMGQILRTEQMWKAGLLSRPEPDEFLLREAVMNALDALQRNVELKRSRYKDRVLPHVLAMNTYWYMYMRTRGSELAKLVGEDMAKRKYKTAAEEAAYSYQAQAWGPLVRLLEREEPAEDEREGAGSVARGKMEAFMRELDENLRRHRSSYCIPDRDLREQIEESVTKVVLPAYAGFLHSHSEAVQGRYFLPPDSVRELLGRLFGGAEVEMERRSSTGGGKTSVQMRELGNRAEKRVDEREEVRGNVGTTEDGCKESENVETRREEDQAATRNLDGRGERREREGSFGRRMRMGGKESFGRKEAADGGEGEESLTPRDVGNERRRNFRRREGNGERKGGSLGRNGGERFRRRRGGETSNSGWRELANQEEQKKMEDEEVQTAVKDEETYFRRRELHNRDEEKNVEEDEGGGGAEEVEGNGRKYLRRREFKNRRNGGSGPLHGRIS